MPKGDEEIIKFMQQTPLFSLCSEKELRGLIKTAKEKEFTAGSPIVKQGDRGVGFYLILEGQVDIKRGDRLLTQRGAGDFFGEMALLDGGPRSADVIATEPTRCLALTKWDLRAIVKSYPDVALHMLEELSRRLRATDQTLTE
ncbi:MAG: cyclic nucleotide-binding domain-containing protein [Candidatus Bipolaricaulia bacterium]